MEADVRILLRHSQVDSRQPGKQKRPTKAPDTFLASKPRTNTLFQGTGPQPQRLRRRLRSLEGCTTSRFLKQTRKPALTGTKVPQFPVGAYDCRRQNFKAFSQRLL